MSQQQNKQQNQNQPAGKKADQSDPSPTPDNPSKHAPDEPANKEPHRESGSGRHEPHP